MITIKANYKIDLGKTVTTATADIIHGKLDENGTITYFTPLEIAIKAGTNKISCDTGDTEVKFLLTVGKKIS